MDNRLGEFVDYFKEKNPIYFKEIQRTIEGNGESFNELGSTMLEWAYGLLGKDYKDVLLRGYMAFVNDVNKHQLAYEKNKAYRNSSYDEVYRNAYDSEEFMDLYHWGVYLTTFVWGHHLKLYDYFKTYFLPLLSMNDDKVSLLDLGCGSGIWHLLALKYSKNMAVTAIDISEPTINMTKSMAKTASYLDSISYICGDAIEYTSQFQHDAVLSCFLLEHLERPQELMNTISRSLKDRGYAWITAALTAAEYDHIYEFRKESEVIELAENAGMRVVEMSSSSPMVVSQTRHYLPRSMALILQKKCNEIW
jgi:2-polyprenyl-3-methyl-5-hydroxy-6-metoxy-1,4-benzoquinol methylase